ncbi:MAG: hypothetical protein LBQ12_08455 [Deltaproteobacteria bacterium]|jgi:hypothetical protein|nr:hypothetical protein [Deltaproteobacteria bacterium]
MIFKPFFSHLARHMEDDELVLPVSSRGEARLLGLLRQEGETMYLALRDNRHEEEIEVGIVCGKLVVLERGVGGTSAHRFPQGSEVSFKVTVSVVEKLICTYDCCSEPCPCAPVAYAGCSLPEATVGTKWHGAVLFAGDGPITIVHELPHWMSSKRDERTLKLSGTPPEAGKCSFTVAAANCNGKHVAVNALQFTVSEPA